MISFKSKGDFHKVTRWLERAREKVHIGVLDKYGRAGVAALAEATPKDSGLTAASWYYEIEENQNGCTITWCNSNVVGGWANVAVLIQRGHGTRQGGFVQGIDYINPALAPVFLDIAEKAFKEVAKL